MTNRQLPAPQHVLRAFRLSRTSGKKASTTDETPHPASHEDEGRCDQAEQQDVADHPDPVVGGPHQHQVRRRRQRQPVLVVLSPEPGPEIRAPSSTMGRTRYQSSARGTSRPYSATSRSAQASRTPRGAPHRGGAEPVTDRRPALVARTWAARPARRRRGRDSSSGPELERAAAGAQRGNHESNSIHQLGGMYALEASRRAELPGDQQGTNHPLQLARSTASTGTGSAQVAHAATALRCMRAM